MKHTAILPKDAISAPLGVISHILPAVDRPRAPAARLLDFYNREQIGAAVEVLLSALDYADGDADSEPNGDERDTSYIEWTDMRGCQKTGHNIALGHEDDEDDDPAGQYDEDEYTSHRPNGWGAGCPISDSDHEHDGREHDQD